MIPPELKWPGQDQQAVARGKQMAEIIGRIDWTIDRPKRALPLTAKARQPRLPMRFFHPDDVQKVRQLLDEGRFEFPRQHNYERMTKAEVLALEGTYEVEETLLSTAIHEGMDGDPNACAKDLAYALKMIDNDCLIQVPNVDAGRYQLLSMFDMLAKNKTLDKSGWKTILEAIPPTSSPDPIALDNIRLGLVYDAENIAGIAPQLNVMRADDGRVVKTLRAYGSIDPDATMRALIKIRQIDFDNAKKPRLKRNDEGVKVAESYGVGLPEFPNPHTDSGWRHPDPNFDANFEAYAKKMDSIPNSLGRRYLSSAEGSWRVDRTDIRQTFLEMLRAYVAIQIYAMDHEVLPKNLNQLVMDKILITLPYDYLGDAPLHYDPVRQFIWSVSSDGTNGNAMHNWPPTSYSYTPQKFDQDWIIALPGAKRPGY